MGTIKVKAKKAGTYKNVYYKPGDVFTVEEGGESFDREVVSENGIRFTYRGWMTPVEESPTSDAVEEAPEEEKTEEMFDDSSDNEEEEEGE